jgi:hypothetical protein
MLSKTNCKLAINNWAITRKHYLQVKELIDPKSVFRFSREDCDWLNENNNNTYFHIYLGVHSSELILIVVPIDEFGKEVDLPSYMISSLAPLTKDLNLVETVDLKKIKRTTLSTDLLIENVSEEIKIPFENEPSLSEDQSLREIQKWATQCYNWFYCECNDYDGQRIVRTFKVPFSDLVKDNQNVNEVHCLFGFTQSSIYYRQIPVLIFVAVDGVNAMAKFLNSGNTDESGNTSDFSSPCPPLCDDTDSYRLL